MPAVNFAQWRTRGSAAIVATVRRAACRRAVELCCRWLTTGWRLSRVRPSRDTREAALLLAKKVAYAVAKEEDQADKSLEERPRALTTTCWDLTGSCPRGRRLRERGRAAAPLFP